MRERDGRQKTTMVLIRGYANRTFSLRPSLLFITSCSPIINYQFTGSDHSGNYHDNKRTTLGSARAGAGL